MELLQRAVAKGFRDVGQVRRDDDLNALRDRDDFRKLLAEFGKKSP
jgi:hypothetical protein